LAAIRITGFGGLKPSTDKAMLPSNAAQKAVNCRLTSDTLDAYKSPLQIYDPGSFGSAIKSIYRFDQVGTNEAQYWFTFLTDVDVVKGAVAGDSQERTYFTGDSYPKTADISNAVGSAPYPTAAFHLGTPAPVTSANVALTPIVPQPGTPAETFVYTYTYVSVWGEESPPAPPSNGLAVKIGDTVNLTGLLVAPAGNYNMGFGAKKRIYRTSTGSTATSYRFVAEIPIATTTYNDTTLTANLGEVLPTQISAILPTGAIGLTNMANGVMAAFMGYDVYFCEAYKPYSWPVSYMQTVDFPVVGLGAFGTSLVILTKGNPYVVTGTDPQSMTLEKLAVPYSCLSKRSICAAFGDVVYASPEGLTSIGISGTKVLTDAVMTRLEWNAYKPSSMLCVVWDNRVFMFYDTGTVQGCLCLDNKQGLIESSVYATAAYTDPISGELYLAIGNKIMKWNANTALTYTWKSKVFTHPNYINFSWGQINANAYPVTLNVYAENNPVAYYTVSVPSIAPFRLPSGSKSKYWELELVGSVPVLEVVVADSLEEIKNV
jgi:hypothetical protein